MASIWPLTSPQNILPVRRNQSKTMIKLNTHMVADWWPVRIKMIPVRSTYTVFKGSRFFLWQNLPILNKANQKGLYLYTIWFRQVSTYYISVFLSNRIIYKKINLYNINYWFYTWKEILAEKSVFYFPSIDPSTFFL